MSGAGAAHAAAGGRAAPHPGTVAGSGRDVAWWGLACLLVTEGMLFAYLLASYFYVRTTHGTWPPPGPPPLAIVAPNTLLLLASSGTAWWAERGARRGARRHLALGLALTVLLGAVFLGLQLVEYRHTEFSPQTDAYGSLFYTITGFHGAHVAAGLLILLHTLLRALTGSFAEPGRHLAVTNATRYWHFVDAVWLVVFASLYLSPRLW